jgi:hypothetical protein
MIFREGLRPKVDRLTNMRYNPDIVGVGVILVLQGERPWSPSR